MNTFSKISLNISSRLTAELNAVVDDSFFDTVLDFPADWNGLNSAKKIGLLNLESDQRYFTQERLLRYRLRLGVLSSGVSASLLHEFADETKRYLSDLGFVDSIYSGLNIDMVDYVVSSANGFRFADILLEVLWVNDRPLILDGSELKQTLLTESVETPTLTAGAGWVLNAANLRDRAPSTIGLSNASPASAGNEALVIDYGTAFAVDYMYFGNVIISGSTTGLIFIDSWDGSAWQNVYALQTANFPTNLFASFLPQNATKYRFRSGTSGSSISFGFLFVGTAHEFEKSYDIRDSSIGVNVSDIQVTTGVDDPQGFKLGSQASGTKKEFWDIRYGLRKAWFDGLVTKLLAAEFNQKVMLFRDTYRNSDFHRVLLQDANLRANQPFQDYLRVNLRMDEQ